ncbi:hypothetical protein R8Z50_04305 [Longispora sp. K20-0274]|uniref:hypothetical protein n=1 Tax=Longispora sp. K20-0274 TaxID=3088255 RepID=UPI00399BF804
MPDKWWKNLLFGLGFVAGGIFLFDYIDGKEQSGEGFRMNWIMVLIYDALGKWGVLGVCLLIAVVFFGYMVAQLARRGRPAENA